MRLPAGHGPPDGSRALRAGCGPGADAGGNQAADASSAGFDAAVDHGGGRDTGAGEAAADPDAGALVDANRAAPTPPDAAKPADAGDAASERADASFVCNPRGAWFATFTEYTGGTCGSPTPGTNPMPVEIDFGDTLQTVLTTPNCTVAAHPTADGCQVVYDQMCTFADDPGVTEREMGTWTMISASEIEGVADVVRTDGTGKIICMSRMNLHAIAK